MDARDKLKYSTCGSDVSKRDRDATREASLESVQESDNVMKTMALRVAGEACDGDLTDNEPTISALEARNWYDLGVQVRKTAVQDEATAVILERLRNGGRASVELACGTGKTRLGVRAVEALVRDKYATKNEPVHVVVLVPTLALIPQTLNEWYERCTRRECPFECEVRSVCSLPNLSPEDRAEACGDVSQADTCEIIRNNKDWSGWNVVVDSVVELRKWLHNTPTHAKPLVRLIVSTYHSVSTVSEAFYKTNMQSKIDLTIFDEAHLTCVKKSTSESSNGVDFSFALRDTHFNADGKINGMTSQRRLFMTATRRVPKGTNVRTLKNGEDEPEAMASSMDDVNVYGECVFRLPMERAIELGLIRDYNVYIVGYKPEKGYKVRIEGQSEEKNTRENFCAKMVALMKAMQSHDAHKGFVFMSEIDAVDAALKFMNDSSLDLGVRNPLFVKNHSKQTGYMTQSKISETFKMEPVGASKLCVEKTFERDFHFKLFESARREDHELVLMFNVRSLGVGVNVPDALAVAFLSGMATPEGLTQAMGRVLRHNAKDPRPGARAILLLPYEIREEEECDAEDDFGNENGEDTNAPESNSNQRASVGSKRKRNTKPVVRTGAELKTTCNVFSALVAADSRFGGALRMLKRGQKLFLQGRGSVMRMSAMTNLKKHLNFVSTDDSDNSERQLMRMRNQVYAAALPLVATQETLDDLPDGFPLKILGSLHSDMGRFASQQSDLDHKTYEFLQDFCSRELCQTGISYDEAVYHVVSLLQRNEHTERWAEFLEEKILESVSIQCNKKIWGKIGMQSVENVVLFRCNNSQTPHYFARPPGHVLRAGGELRTNESANGCVYCAKKQPSYSYCMLTENYTFVTKYVLWPINHDLDHENITEKYRAAAQCADRGQREEQMAKLKNAHELNDKAHKRSIWTQIAPGTQETSCLFKCSEGDSTCFYVDEISDALKRYTTCERAETTFRCKSCYQKNSLGALLAKSQFPDLSFHWLREKPLVKLDAASGKCEFCRDIEALDRDGKCLLDELDQALKDKMQTGLAEQDCGTSMDQRNNTSRKTAARIARNTEMKAIVECLQEKTRREPHSYEELCIRDERCWTTPRHVAFLRHYEDEARTHVLTHWLESSKKEKAAHTLPVSGRDNFLVFCRRKQDGANEKYAERFQHCSHVHMATANNFFVEKSDGGSRWLERKHGCTACSKRVKTVTVANGLYAMKNTERVEILKREFLQTTHHKSFMDLRCMTYRSGQVPKWKCSQCQEEFYMHVTARYDKSADHDCGSSRSKKMPNILQAEDKRRFVRDVEAGLAKTPRVSIQETERRWGVGKGSYSKWKTKYGGESQEMRD